MKIIYAVVAVIFSAVAWICTQTVWEYQWILEYIAIFLASWFVVLIFVYQEEHESSKKYTILTPSNLIYVAVLLIIFIVLRKYNLKDWQTNTHSFWKAVTLLNAIQGVVIILYYKFRDLYHRM